MALKTVYCNNGGSLSCLMTRDFLFSCQARWEGTVTVYIKTGETHQILIFWKLPDSNKTSYLWPFVLGRTVCNVHVKEKFWLNVHWAERTKNDRICHFREGFRKQLTVSEYFSVTVNSLFYNEYLIPRTDSSNCEHVKNASSDFRRLFRVTHPIN